MDFKSEFNNKFEMFDKRFTTYADVTNESITTNINNTLSEVTEKINSEHEQKFREKNSFNTLTFLNAVTILRFNQVKMQKNTA